MDRDYRLLVRYIQQAKENIARDRNAGKVFKGEGYQVVEILLYFGPSGSVKAFSSHNPFRVTVNKSMER
jgi:hypothetical protein